MLPGSFHVAKSTTWTTPGMQLLSALWAAAEPELTGQRWWRWATIFQVEGAWLGGIPALRSPLRPILGPTQKFTPK